MAREELSEVGRGADFDLAPALIYHGSLAQSSLAMKAQEITRLVIYQV